MGRRNRKNTKNPKTSQPKLKGKVIVAKRIVNRKRIKKLYNFNLTLKVNESHEHLTQAYRE